MEEEYTEKHEPLNAVSDDIEVHHERANHFLSTHATGALVGGPTPHDLFYLTFFSDMINIMRETGRLIESPADEEGITKVYYGLGIQAKDVKNYREDHATIVMTREAATALVNLLHHQLQYDPNQPQQRSSENDQK